jgi:YYY domain-containing protein
MIELILWYLVLSLLGVLAMPMAYRFLPFLSDRGYTLSRTLGLLLWGFIFWLLASLHILQNDTGGVLAALALLGGISWWASGGLKGWREMVRWLKSRPRLLIITEILFLAAFLLMAMMRAASPEISGTEKPMELAFINAILHSPSLPPADPWLSGYSISYYYFGYVMVSMLIHITGAVSGAAFNLAIAMVFALAAIGSYGIAYSLLAAWSRMRQSEGRKGIFSQGWALLAPLFILVISNLEGGFEMLHATGSFWVDNGLSQQSQFWTWLGELELNQPPSEPYSLIPNRQGGIWWWRASRVLQDYNLDAEVHQLVPGIPFSSYIVAVPPVSNSIEVIDEFPFFSFYLADLHPHVLSIPFVMLAIALALNLYLRGAQEALEAFNVRKWLGRAEFWLTAVVLGGLAFLNTWDFPIYLVLFCAAYTLVRFQQAGWQWWPRIKEFIGLALAIGIPGILLYLPFYTGFSSQAGGILPSLVFFTRGIHFWIMFGVLLVPVIFWLFWLGRQQGKKHIFTTGLKFAAIVVAVLWVGSYLLGILGLNLANLGSLISASQGNGAFSRLSGSLVSWGSLFMNLQGGSSPAETIFGSISRRFEMPGTWLTLGFLLAGVWALLASFRPACAVQESNSKEIEAQPEAPALFTPALADPNPFVLLMVLVGVGLTLAPEFVYLRDQFGTRMNTIFKLYYQSWMLWGLSAAFALALIWNDLRGKLAVSGRVLTSVVCLVALAYPYFGIRDRLINSPISSWTLDGNAYIEQYNPNEKSAMEWLSQAPYGVIAEAVGGSYSGAARMATQSGLPDVLGWTGHESQWRGGALEMGSRQDDISTLYRTRDWNEALKVIQRYHIQYIVVGQLEISTYAADSQNGLRALDDQKFMKNLKVAYQNNSVTIYETDQTR